MCENSPFPVGLDRAKRYFSQHTFQIERHGNKKRHKQADKKPKSTSRTNNARQGKPRKEPKEPRSKGTPLTPEQKREKRRVTNHAIYENAKALGQCRKPTCEERAIHGQTRCETHAEEHRIWRREYDRKRRATAKESKPVDISTKQQTTAATGPLIDTPTTETDGKPVPATLDEQTSAPKQPAGRKETNNRSPEKGPG